jgi:aspartate 1-decarboxylase
VQVGDIIIVISYAQIDFEEAKSFKPTFVFPDVETKYGCKIIDFEKTYHKRH